MICPNCQHELSDMAKFCPYCGTALKTSESVESEQVNENSESQELELEPKPEQAPEPVPVQTAAPVPPKPLTSTQAQMPKKDAAINTVKSAVASLSKVEKPFYYLGIGGSAVTLLSTFLPLISMGSQSDYSAQSYAQATQSLSISLISPTVMGVDIPGLSMLAWELIILSVAVAILIYKKKHGIAAACMSAAALLALNVSGAFCTSMQSLTSVNSFLAYLASANISIGAGTVFMLLGGCALAAAVIYYFVKQDEIKNH